MTLPAAPDGPTPVADQEGWLQAHPTWLYGAIRAGSLGDERDQEAWPIEVREVGALPLPSGRLVLCDPIIVEVDHPPMSTALPVGEYPVAVARARVGEDHHRTAAALLVLGQEPVARWAMARPDGDAPDDWAEIGDFTGYGVDAGTGAFADAEALADLERTMREDEGMLEDPISTALHDDEDNDTGAVVAAPREGALAVAAFESGWGDGVYPTWIGHAADDSVSVVMTDFLLAGDPWVDGGGGSDSVSPVGGETDDDDSDRDEPDAGAARHGNSDGADRGEAQATDASAPRQGFWARLFGR